MSIVKNTLLVAVLGTGLLSAGSVLATVNGKKIMSEDADRFVKTSSPSQTFAKVNAKDREKIVNRLVERVLFLEAAQKSGIAKSAEYLASLERAKEELLINQWMMKQFESTVVSDSEAKEFYAKNIAKFKMPEKVRARHILLKSKKDANAVIAALKDLKGDALKGKFVELAKSKSTGPTGSKGGDLGFFAKGQMVAPFSNAAFALTKGAMTTKPVKTQFGYHVIYLEDKMASTTTPYEQVKEKIVQTLKQQQFRSAMTESLKEMKKNAKIVIEKAPKK